MEKIKVYIIIAVLVLVGVAAFVLINAVGGQEGAGDATDGFMNGTTATDLPANADTENNTTGTPQANSTEVTIKSHAFTPATMTVKKGTTVTWTNQDVDEHDVTPDNPDNVFQQSEMLGRGDSYSVTFTETGSYTYHCSPHDYMTGTIEVVE